MIRFCIITLLLMMAASGREWLAVVSSKSDGYDIFVFDNEFAISRTVKNDREAKTEKMYCILSFDVYPQLRYLKDLRCEKVSDDIELKKDTGWRCELFNPERCVRDLSNLESKRLDEHVKALLVSIEKQGLKWSEYEKQFEDLRIPDF